MEKTDWKNKSKANSKDKKYLNKRIRELKKSRDDWRDKSIHHKARADKLECDLNKLKKKILDIMETA